MKKHTLRQQTSRNLLHKVPPGSRPYVCNECRTGQGRRNLFLVIRKFILVRNLINVSSQKLFQNSLSTNDLSHLVPFTLHIASLHLRRAISFVNRLYTGLIACMHHFPHVLLKYLLLIIFLLQRLSTRMSFCKCLLLFQI